MGVGARQPLMANSPGPLLNLQIRLRCWSQLPRVSSQICHQRSGVACDATRLHCWQICSDSSKLSPTSCEFHTHRWRDSTRQRVVSAVCIGLLGFNERQWQSSNVLAACCSTTNNYVRVYSSVLHYNNVAMPLCGGRLLTANKSMTFL